MIWSEPPPDDLDRDRETEDCTCRDILQLRKTFGRRFATQDLRHGRHQETADELRNWSTEELIEEIDRVERECEGGVYYLFQEEIEESQPEEDSL